MADKEADNRPAPAEPMRQGIVLAEFNRWKHHPVTALFRRYLSDKAADTRDGVIDAWLGGDLELAVEQEARGAINAYQTMSRLLGPDKDGLATFHEITGFYDQADQPDHSNQEEQDADETA